MRHEDYDAAAALVYEVMAAKGFGPARREAAELLDVPHVGIHTFGDLVKRGRELADEKKEASDA